MSRHRQFAKLIGVRSSLYASGMRFSAFEQRVLRWAITNGP